MKPNRILRFEIPDAPASGVPRPSGGRTDQRETVVVDSLSLFKTALTLRTYDAILCVKGMPGPDALEAMQAAYTACPEAAFLFLTSQAADAWDGFPEKDGLPNPATAGSVRSRDAKALREANERNRRDQANLRSLMENTGDIMVSLDMDFRVMAFNSQASLLALKLSGHPLTNGSAFLEHLDEPRREVWRRIRDRIRARESFRQGFNIQVRGKNLILESVLSPVLDGGIISGIAMVSRDVTDIRESETKHKEKEKRDALEILHSRDRLEAILQGVSDTIMAIDPAGKLTFANLAAAKGLGFGSVAELLATSAGEIKLRTELFWEDGSLIKECDSWTNLAFSSGKPQSGVARWHLRGSPEFHWSVFKSTPVLNADGSVRNVLNTSVDITEQKRAGLNLIKAKEAAEEASRAKGRFLANMSHEIRTPMNGIMSMAGLLGEMNLDSKQRHFVSVIVASGHSLMRIINDILDVSRIEQGKLQIESHPFDLNEMVSDALTLMETQAEEKGLELGWSIAPGIPSEYLGDSGRLRQVLLNLIGNSIKFTEKGRIDLRVSAPPRLGGKAMLRFDIEDTGIGIDMVESKTIFEPFSQSDNSDTRRFGGTGLGLSICKQLVSLLGGEIGFTSRLGRGSHFWFTARLDAQKLSKADCDRLRPSAVKVKPRNRPPLRILVAEDNSINQIVICSLLESLGQTTDLVANGREALEAWRTRPYDLIFMDCQMPEMDGYTATNRIRHLESKGGKKRVFIAAMTADAQNGTRAKCKEAGMDEYITKPIMTDKLQDMISQAGTKAGAEAEADSATGKSGSLTGDVPSGSLDLRILDRLRLLSEGDESGLFLDLVSSFLEQASEKISGLGKTAELRDFPSLAKSAHGLKGLSLNFGALAMTRKCEALQTVSEAGNLPAVMEALAGLNDAFTDTRIAFSGLPGLDGQGFKGTIPAVPAKGGTDVR